MEYPSESLMNISNTYAIEIQNAPCIRIQNHGTGDNLWRDPQNKSTDRSTYNHTAPAFGLSKCLQAHDILWRGNHPQRFFLNFMASVCHSNRLVCWVWVFLCFAFLDANTAQTDFDKVTDYKFSFPSIGLEKDHLNKHLFKWQEVQAFFFLPGDCWSDNTLCLDPLRRIFRKKEEGEGKISQD